MRIFQQVTDKGEVITWYGFSDSDVTEVGQHVIVLNYMQSNGVAFNNEDGTLTKMYQYASNAYLNLENPN